MTTALHEPASPPTSSAATPGSDETDSQAPCEIEFAGWLPCFTFFGDCGRHPQFGHTAAPPAGYRFVCSGGANQAVPANHRAPLIGGVRTVLGAAWLLIRPFCSAIRNARRFGFPACLRTLAAVAGLFLALRRAGCGFWATIQFLRTRHFASQIQAPPRAKLLFLTSVPFICNQRPWIIEIEDPITLFFPFHLNGCTRDTPIRRSPYWPIVKALLESDACRGIVTHMRSTAAALPQLFQSEKIALKTAYIPCATELPAVAVDQSATDRLDLLFTCSWHQLPVSFFLRGGLDVLRAFEIVQERYPHVRLTLRTRLPELKPRYRRILEKCWVRVIDRFLPNEDMDDLMRSSHVFLLPAARMHVVSVLRAMAFGQAVIASDGWGFREYVEHGRNGLIVPGRHGKTSWMDEDTGFLREDHEPMFRSSTSVATALADAIGVLVEDHALRRRLSAQARRDAATRFSVEQWNRGLKAVLDGAVRPGTKQRNPASHA
ncbi:MAG TPA: glycosyltransferase family 4 protein [Gemmataceae bacterium]|nr:glycosyltransferase family 4 protein [Gemmataceae bacterium]